MDPLNLPPAFHTGNRHTETGGCIGGGHAGAVVNAPSSRGATTSETLPLFARPGKARMNPFLDATALELCDRTENAGDESAGRGASVDALTETDESDAAGLPSLGQLGS